MIVTVLFLGGSRIQAGCRETQLELPGGSTLGDLAQRVAKDFEALAPHLPQVRWAHNFEFAPPSTPLKDGDEVAVIPPVAGGAPSAAVTKDPIDVQAVVRDLAEPSVGATVFFVGTVRDHARGKSVQRLEYEAYEPMAARQLQRIATRCEEEHPDTRVQIIHRHGTLEVGDVAVVIGAASAHREQAFAACRQAIEHIKVDVPIWKKELTTDGEEWVGWGGG